jgi:hypothetical protein
MASWCKSLTPHQVFPLLLLLLCITLKPRVEWFQSLWTLNTSPPRNRSSLGSVVLKPFTRVGRRGKGGRRTALQGASTRCAACTALEPSGLRKQVFTRRISTNLYTDFHHHGVKIDGGAPLLYQNWQICTILLPKLKDLYHFRIRNGRICTAREPCWLKTQVMFSALWFI